MAAEWMKIELALPDKPEVHYIASNLHLDPDAVVGKLVRIWAWFDKHTTDGNAYGVTIALVDRLTGVTGFGEAMMFSGWLEQHDKTLHMPKFDAHTSESAKKRALTAKRQGKFRNADVTQEVTQQALPRKEKKRYTPVSPNGEFERFWQAYPKRKSRADAEKAFAKVNPDEQLLAVMLAAIAKAKTQADWQREGGKFVPYPASWLNGKRWLDEDITLIPVKKTAAI